MVTTLREKVGVLGTKKTSIKRKLSNSSLETELNEATNASSDVTRLLKSECLIPDIVKSSVETVGAIHRKSPREEDNFERNAGAGRNNRNMYLIPDSGVK